MAFANRPGINTKPSGNTLLPFLLTLHSYHATKSKAQRRFILHWIIINSIGWDDDEDEGPQLRGASSGPYGNPQTNQPKPAQVEIKSPISSGSFKSDDITGTSPAKKGNPAIDYEIIQMNEQFVLAQ